MAYLSEGSKVGGKQIETVDGAQAKANQARDSAVDTVLRWAKDLGLGTTAKAIQNWDELEQTGFYSGNNNGPLGNIIVFGIHVQYYSNYGLQVVGRHNRLFIRTWENGIWNGWRELESVDKVNSKLNALKNELTSLIDDTKNQLQSKVSRTEFENLRVGGRNLLVNSSQEFRTIILEQWGAYNRYELIWQKPLEELGLKNGDYITLSMYFDDVSEENSVAMRFDFNREDNSYVNVSGQQITKPGRYSFTAKIPDSQEFVKLSIRLMPKDSQSNYGYQIKYKEAKLEKGNKATDWTPAPEDIFQEITNVKNSSAPVSHVGSGGDAHALATPSAHGFMSSSDKAKLDGIQAGAEVNQNTFSTIKVGSTNVVADSKTDTLELVAGTNVVLTPDATNDRITIGLSSNVETVSGAQAKANAVQANLNAHIGSGGNAHALATTSNHGFMSSSDKSKLDGIQAGAEVNQNAFTHIKVGSTTVSADSKTDTLELVAGTNVVLTPDATNDKITIGLSGNVETTSGAQAKANKAEENAKSASVSKTGDTMTGTLKFNTPLPSGVDTSDTPDKWANDGITYYNVNGSGKLKGQPRPYGKILHIAHAGVKFQYFFEWSHPQGSPSPSIWYRHAGEGDTVWGQWQKIWHDGNDGSGSGLDADTIDGKHFSDIQADAQSRVNAHANRKDNPHGVTKAQVGLGSVENYGIATQAEAEAGTANNKYMTPLRTKQLVDKEVEPLKTRVSNAEKSINQLSNEVSTKVINAGVAYFEDWQMKNIQWYDIPLLNGAEPPSGIHTPQWTRVGEFIILRGTIKNIQARGTYAQLPPEARPTKPISFVQNTSSYEHGARFARWIINTDGRLVLEGNSDSNFLDWHWYPIDIVYLRNQG